MRPCLDCGVLTTSTRCPVHTAQRERHRGSPSRRGYGPDHRKARAALALTLPDFCGYGCGTLLYPDGKWVAAHRVDGDASAGYLASCGPCNERAKRR